MSCQSGSNLLSFSDQLLIYMNVFASLFYFFGTCLFDNRQKNNKGGRQERGFLHELVLILQIA